MAPSGLISGYRRVGTSRNLSYMSFHSAVRAMTHVRHSNQPFAYFQVLSPKHEGDHMEFGEEPHRGGLKGVGEAQSSRRPSACRRIRSEPPHHPFRH